MTSQLDHGSGGKPFTVVSLGDLVTDVVIHIPQLPVQAAQHQLADCFSIEPGGAGNFLIAGSRLGMNMIALGALGDDPFGRITSDILVQEGVDMRQLIVPPGSSTTSVAVLADQTGQHVFLGKYGVGPKIVMPKAWVETSTTADALFSFGYSLQDERFSSTCLEAMQLASQHGVPVFFDPGPEMARTTQPQRDAAVRLSRVLLMTEEEIPFLAEGQTGLEAARALLDKGPQLVCVKRGAHGCVVFSHDEEVVHPGYPVPLRDTAAAGDSFAAAFIYASLSGWDLEHIAAFANAMGAAKVQKVGSGTQVPSLSEVQAVLDTFKVNLKIRQE
jgi:sugar/nucleoside kinase (ribokinase family)